MSPKRVGCACSMLLSGFLSMELLAPGAVSGQAPGQVAAGIPSAGEVTQLLQKEPITLASWPRWRLRLLGWIGDKSHATNLAWEAGRDFVKRQAVQGQLPPPLKDDAFAWYLLGSAYLYGKQGDNVKPDAQEAERAFRQSLKLDPKFARAHRNLALALLLQDTVASRAEAQAEIAETRRLDPAISTHWVEAQAAMLQKRFAEAERHFRAGLREDPRDVDLARGAAHAALMGWNKTGRLTPQIKPLLDQFPNDPVLICLHAVALAADDRVKEARSELNRARELGADPKEILSSALVEKIDEAGAPGWLERFAWIMVYLAGFYLVVMALMAAAGLVLASRTKGPKALDLIGAQPEEMVAAGQVLRTRHESLLATLYSFALFLGLILFYGTIPFVIAGLLAATASLLYLIFLMPRIPIKLIVIIVVVGGGMAWAVLKSLFARAGSGGFGIAKTAAECPRLYQALEEVARRVDTDPVNEVCLAPGSSIGVHQEAAGRSASSGSRSAC